MGNSSCAVVYTILGLILALIVIANGIVVLYSCLVWHQYDNNEINARFMVGIIIFVTCTTLPFALITGYLICSTSYCTFNLQICTCIKRVSSNLKEIVSIHGGEIEDEPASPT